MEQKAVIDRIEDGEHAVLLVGDEETEYVVPAAQLPEDAQPGMWLRVQIEDGVIVEVVVDQAETEQMARGIAGKLARVRRKRRRLRPLKEDEEAADQDTTE